MRFDAPPRKQSSMRSMVMLGLSLVFILVLIARLRSCSSANLKLGSTPPPAVTKTLAGEAWSLADHKGKVVLIDFWATWCPPCRASMPYMKKIHADHRENPDFVMVGVSLDRNQGELKDYLRSEKIEWLQLFEGGGGNALARAFGVRAIPSVFIIDRQGRVVGADLRDHGKIKQILEAELAKAQ